MPHWIVGEHEMAPTKIAIIGGSRKKNIASVPAREMFRSNYYKLALNYVESKFEHKNNTTLDSMNGISTLDQVIVPFDKQLKGMKADEKKAWIEKVVEQLEKVPKGSTLIFFCGSDYTKLVTVPLEAKGFVVETPLKELGGLGSHLQFYKNNGPAIPKPEKPKVKKGRKPKAKKEAEVAEEPKVDPVTELISEGAGEVPTEALVEEAPKKKPTGKSGEKKPSGKSADKKPSGKSADKKPSGKSANKKASKEEVVEEVVEEEKPVAEKKNGKKK
jgi:hypothetical protein